MTDTILVVNDDLGVRTLIQIMLQRAGYQTLKAVDGIEGFEVAKTQLPDLIVSDTMMPNANGREFLQMLRREPTTHHIPYILIAFGREWETAVGWVEDIQLVAPFKPEELIASVQTLLGEKGTS